MVAPSEVYVRAVWRDVGLNQTGLRRGVLGQLRRHSPDLGSFRATSGVLTIRS